MPKFLARIIVALLVPCLVVASGQWPVTGNPFNPSGHGTRVTDPIFSSQALSQSPKLFLGPIFSRPASAIRRWISRDVRDRVSLSKVQAGATGASVALVMALFWHLPSAQAVPLSLIVVTIHLMGLHIPSALQRPLLASSLGWEIGDAVPGAIFGGLMDTEAPPIERELLDAAGVSTTDVRRFHEMHIVIADDFPELLDEYERLLVPSGLFQKDHVHTHTRVEEAAKKVHELTESGVPDSQILVITDLAFGLNGPSSKRRDGVDLINELRLAPDSPVEGYEFKLGFKGRILIVSGSTPANCAKEDLFNQDAKPYGFEFEQKVKIGNFDVRFLRGLYQILREPPDVAATIHEPLTKSAKFRFPSLRTEDWATFDTLVNLIGAKASDLRSQLMFARKQASSSEDADLFRDALVELRQFIEIADQPYPDEELKLHDFGSRTIALGGHVNQIRDIFKRLSEPGLRQRMTDNVQFRMFLDAIERAHEFAYDVQVFDEALRRREAKSSLVTVLEKSVNSERVRGKLIYNGARRAPQETLMPELKDVQVSEPLAFITSVIFENILDAYEARESQRGERANYAQRPVNLEFTSDASGLHRVTITDQAGGLDEEIDPATLFDAGQRNKTGHPGFGLYWAKQLAETQGIKITVASEPGKGTRFEIDLPGPKSPKLERSEPARPATISSSPMHRSLEEEAARVGGKIAGYRRLQAASKDVGNKVPADAELDNETLWQPFLKANARLVDQADRIVAHRQHLIEQIHAQAHDCPNEQALFERLQKFAPVLGLERIADLFGDDFTLANLEDHASRQITPKRIGARIDLFLERLTERMELPKELAAVIRDKDQELTRLIAERGERSTGKRLARSSDRTEDGFNENLAGELLTEDYQEGSAPECALKLLKYKAKDALVVRRMPLAGESFSVQLVNYHWFSDGFIAFTDLGGRLVVELNVGQPDTLASGGSNATTVEFDMDDQGQVRTFLIRQPFHVAPDDIHFQGRHYVKSAKSPKDTRQLLDLYEGSTVEVTDSSGKTYRCPVAEAHLRQLAEMLWKLQRHSAFGYRLDIEGGLEPIRDGMDIVTVQARPIVGIPETAYEALPENLPGSRRSFDAPIAYGRGRWENQRVVLIREGTDPAAIREIDRRFPEGYIRVQAGVADEAGLNAGSAQVLMDPRKGSRFAHNVNLLSKRVGAGELCYLAGASLQEDLRTLDYEEAAPDIRVSRQTVTVAANLLSARLFVMDPPDAKGSVPNALAALTLFEAIRSNGEARFAIVLNDNQNVLDTAQAFFEMSGIDGIFTTNLNDAVRETLNRNREAILFIDASVQDVYSYDVIHNLRERGFQGLIVGYSAGNFMARLGNWVDVTALQKELHQTFWTMEAGELLNLEYLGRLAEVLKANALREPPMSDEIYSLSEAIKAIGATTAIVLNDEADVASTIRASIQDTEILNYVTTNPRQAIEEAVRLGRKAVLFVDALLGFDDGARVIRRARELGFEGLIIGYSGIPFMQHLAEFASVGDLSDLKNELARKTLWTIDSTQINNDEFWQGISAAFGAKKSAEPQINPLILHSTNPDSSTPAVRTASMPSAQRTYPIAESRNLDEAIAANGLPKKVIIRGFGQENDEFFAGLWEKQGIDTVPLEDYRDALRQAERWGERAVLVAHRLSPQMVETTLRNPKFKGILVCVSGGLKKREAMEAHVNQLGEDFKGRCWAVDWGDVFGTHETLSKTIANFNQRVVRGVEQTSDLESQPRSSEMNILDAALREERVQAQEFERYGYDRELAMLWLEIKTTTGAPPSWRKQLMGLQDQFEYERYNLNRGGNDSVLLEFSQDLVSPVPPEVRLDPELARLLIRLRDELAYPSYPSPQDSRIVQMVSDFAAHAERQLAGEPEAKTSAMAAPAPRPPSPVLVAVDDVRLQVEKYRALIEDRPGAQFFPFASMESAVEDALDFLGRNPVTLLVMDIWFNGNYLGRDLLEAAIRTAEEKGTSFDALVVSNGEEDKVAELRSLAQAYPRAVRSFDRARRNEWRRPLERLLGSAA